MSPLPPFVLYSSLHSGHTCFSAQCCGSAPRWCGSGSQILFLFLFFRPSTVPLRASTAIHSSIWASRAPEFWLWRGFRSYFWLRCEQIFTQHCSLYSVHLLLKGLGHEIEFKQFFYFEDEPLMSCRLCHFLSGKVKHMGEILCIEVRCQITWRPSLVPHWFMVHWLNYWFLLVHCSRSNIQGGSDKSGIFFFLLSNDTAQLKTIRFDWSKSKFAEVHIEKHFIY